MYFRTRGPLPERADVPLASTGGNIGIRGVWSRNLLDDGKFWPFNSFKNKDASLAPRPFAAAPPMGGYFSRLSGRFRRGHE